MAQQAFNPYLIDEAGTKVFLPLPINTFTIAGTYKRDSKERPVTDGAISYGHATRALSISIDGVVHKDSNGTYTREEDGVEAILALKDLLDGVTDSNRLRLVIYTTASPSYHLWLDKVVPDGLTQEIGDASDGDTLLIGYSLQLTAEDPAFKTTTAPDEA